MCLHIWTAYRCYVAHICTFYRYLGPRAKELLATIRSISSVIIGDATDKFDQEIQHINENVGGRSCSSKGSESTAV